VYGNYSESYHFHRSGDQTGTSLAEAEAEESGRGQFAGENWCLMADIWRIFGLKRIAA
jgi:hypothetical protein